MKKTKTTDTVNAVKNKTSPSCEEPVKEIGGRKGPEPTRYGDWENNGRCVDF